MEILVPLARRAAPRSPLAALGSGATALLLLLLPAALAPSAASAQEAALRARVQLHRSYNRGVPYVPTARHGARPGASALSMRATRKIELDGDPLGNVYANLRPIDVDGDGRYEFLHWNGFRSMQVWAADGRKLWRVANPEGRTNEYEQGVRRDTAAILDLDGDGKQDVAHCWRRGNERQLVYRRGLDGKVIRSTAIPGSLRLLCQIAAFRTEATGDSLILVAEPNPPSAGCKRNHIDTWARTVAFDSRQRKLWERNTCDAGHFAYPLDADHDGRAEGVHVGKYLLGTDGSLRCKLDTWPAADHTDSVAIADLDPARPGLETVAVGASGAAMFSTASCKQLWRIPSSVINNPQYVTLAKLDPSVPTPLIVIHEKTTSARATLFTLDRRGRVLARKDSGDMPMQNANLDGALGVDEHVASFGTVLDRNHNVRLGRSWFWNLRGRRVLETRNGPYPTSFDRWQAFPVVFDLDHDGRDEIVQWSQSLILVSKVP